MKKKEKTSPVTKFQIKPINETPADLSHFISMDQIVAMSVFNKEFSDLKEDLKKQKEFSWQIVIGVAVVFVLAILSAVWEVVIFHTNSNKDLYDFQKNNLIENNDLRRDYDQKFMVIQKQIDDINNKLTPKK